MAILKKTTGKKVTFNQLHRWNVAMAVLHAIQGLLVIVLSKSNAWTVSTSYLQLDEVATKILGRPVLESASRDLFDVNLAYIVATFFFMSAIAHTLIATIYRKQYERNLSRGINKARWIEYGFSASVMMIGIALLSGIYDLSTLIMIFVLDMIMNLLGLVMETHNEGKKQPNWLSYWIGCLAGIVPWVVFGIYVWGATVYGGRNIPTFVYWIYVSIFLFFNSFAVNMYLQYKKKGKWSDYLYGERAYMVLSLVAKSVLAWQVFAGSLRP